MSADFNSLQKDFKSEPKEKQIILASAVVVFFSVFMPWFVYANSYISYSENGMNGLGVLSFLASLAALSLWVLPKFDVKLPIDKKQKKMAIQGSTVAMAIPPVYYFLILISDKYVGIGIGIWIALLASGAAVYMAFVGCKKNLGSNNSVVSDVTKAQKVEETKQEKVETPKDTK